MNFLGEDFNQFRPLFYTGKKTKATVAKHSFKSSYHIPLAQLFKLIIYAWVTMCLCVGVYTCVKCKQNGCHSLCCCCRLPPDGCDAENAVANTKRAKNASKLLESWKIEFCVPPGRTLRTAHTHTHTHRVFCVFVLVFFGLLHASATNAHSKPIRAQRQTHTHAHTDGIRVRVEIWAWVWVWIFVLAHYHRPKWTRCASPVSGKKCCAYVAAFEAPAKQKFKLHFYFLDTL